MKTRTWFLFGALLAMALLASAAAASNWTFGSNQSDHDTWLGIQSQSVDYDIADAFDLNVPYGVIVNSVIAGSPADDAGIKEGDVILGINGADITDAYELDDALLRTKAGETASLKVNRQGKEMTVDVKLEKRPSREMRLRNDGHVVVVSPDGTSWTVKDDWSGPRRGYMGVTLVELNDQLADYFGAPDGGALVSEVEEDSPAEKAGIKAGDIIVALAHEDVYDADDVNKVLERFRKGDEVTVDVLRDRQRQSMQVTVDETDGDYFYFGGWNPADIRVEMPDIPAVPQIDLPHIDTRYWSDKDRKELREELRQAQREVRESLRDSQGELKKQLDELRQQMKELQEKLD